MFAWYKAGSPQQKKTFWACYSGWALDSFDMQMFSFLLPALTLTWGLTKAEVGVLGTVALVVTAIGGWGAGILSDRYGRARILVLAIIWFTLFGVLAGFAQSYQQLLIARTLQGLGFGGEWAVGAALMAEVIDSRHRGKAIGFVQSGFALGWALAVVVATLLLAWLPKEMAWRVAFWSGIIPALIVLFIRRHVKDSSMFERARQSRAPRASLSSVFNRKYARTLALSSVLVIGLQAGCYAILVWLPSLLNQRQVAAGSMIVTVFIMAFGSFCGFAVTADLSDRIGRRPTLILLSVCAWIVTVSYMLLPLNTTLTAILGFLVGFSAIGMFAALGPFLSELFPTNVRTTCMGFAYNVGKSIGAGSVVGVGVLSTHIGLANAMGTFCLVAYAFAVFGIMLLPETRGIAIENIGEADAHSPAAPLAQPASARS
ncbi:MULTISPECIES: MFS transporter [Cupriavidus]|uniref:Probable 4-methylmuconolactone transporter n=1 Tax=Cupriavidus pinatubonensis (strain JMP 134 / LMG 1197) TaxID=264198 RepID=MMLH_CUPPJ|nr:MULTISPECIES: MFS transporter [Cupriavidus]O51798.1 RecName: Full=Probable 4-methylmuconolactone transporter [Cupriavidus pinatubonensis JMP134]QYY33060.1 MFS transporter [Cupriavidus pinatubonensis]TPQ39153.1 MFS transporter [Cupriavidus pinatubonensis]CAA67957.1 transport protein [Cupriavidus pinatubonensis JMP134]